MTYIEFTFNDKVLQIDSKLAEALASCAYNIEADWDMVILVTGNRTVRTGKSVMAMTIAAFVAYMLKKLKINDDAFKIENIFFDGKRMLDAAQKLKYSVIVMDEARESLAASKSTMQLQQSILDFFTECGQLRNIFIVVLPDYFDLKEMIAVPRSEMLINVYREDSVVHKDFMGDGIKRPITMFHRGFFKFYNRDAKQLMYDIFRTTRRKEYWSVKPTFPAGRFCEQYPLDEQKYREMKKEALARFKEKHEEKETKMEVKFKAELVQTYKMLRDAGLSNVKIGEALGKTPQAISKFISQNSISENSNSIFDKKKDTGYVAVP